MEHDAWFFIGVFVFIFIIWIAIGGPLRPIPISLPTLPKGLATSGDTKIGLPRAPYGIGNSNVQLPQPSELERHTSTDYLYGGGTYATTPTPLTGIAFGSPSYYRNIVTMDPYVSSASSSNPNFEYIRISVSQTSRMSVDISGWKLVSEATGNTGIIPRGTPIPTSGVVNKAEDIILKPGEHAALISGRSPIGTSFRENLCTGYFATFQDFSPSLPSYCPAPKDELVKYYGPYYVRDESCIEYVDTLSRCQAVTYVPRTLSGVCQSFLLQHLNYNACVLTHAQDQGFSGDTWHVYLGAGKPLWRSQHEVIKLLDTEGKTVDAFSY